MKKDTLTAAEFRIAVRNIRRDYGDDTDGANRLIANMTDVWDIIPDPEDPDQIPKPVVKPVTPKPVAKPVITDDESDKPVVTAPKIDEERVRALVLSRNPYTPLSQVSQYEWDKAREIVGLTSVYERAYKPDASPDKYAEMTITDAKKAIANDMAASSDTTPGYDIHAALRKQDAEKAKQERQIARDAGYTVHEPKDGE